MTKMLKVDNDFTPCPVTSGDELFPNGIFEFNITKILEYIHKNSDSITLEEVAVSDFFKGFSSIDESHVDSVDISLPVILAEISPGQYNLIDCSLWDELQALSSLYQRKKGMSWLPRK